MNCATLNTSFQTVDNEEQPSMPSQEATSIEIAKILQLFENKKHQLKMNTPLKWHHHTPTQTDIAQNRLSITYQKRRAKRAERRSSGQKRIASPPPLSTNDRSTSMEIEPEKIVQSRLNNHQDTSPVITVPLETNYSKISNIPDLYFQNCPSRIPESPTQDNDPFLIKTEFPGIGVIPLSEAFEELENRVKSSNETISSNGLATGIIFKNDPFLNSASRHCANLSTVNDLLPAEPDTAMVKLEDLQIKESKCL